MAKLEAARAAFGEVGYGFEAHVARTELTYWIGEWQQRLNEFTAMPGSRGSGNARKQHIKYWTALRRLWQATARDATKQKPLLAFLLACSEPLFPTATNNKTLIAFIERAASRKRR
jgi:hypothetical protein